MDRAEATGLGVAVAGHLLLFGLLSAGFATAVKKPILSEPMEVAIVEDVGLESAAPISSNDAPAPKLAEIEGLVEPAPLPPLPEPVMQPVPQPQPTPAPPQPVKRTPVPPKPAPAAAKPVPAKAAPAKPTPAKAQPVAKAALSSRSNDRPTGRLSGLLNGISDRDSPSRSTSSPAKVASAAVQASLAGEIRRQLKPHWKAPTGADVELLRTELSISLAPNGRVTNVEVLRTTGQNESNRPQVKLHQEQAVRAVRLASPFRLPPEYYDAWKLLSPIGFDKRLSQ